MKAHARSIQTNSIVMKNLLTGEKKTFEVEARAGWLTVAYEEAALYWGVCWDSLKMV